MPFTQKYQKADLITVIRESDRLLYFVQSASGVQFSKEKNNKSYFSGTILYHETDRLSRGFAKKFDLFDICRK